MKKILSLFLAVMMLMTMASPIAADNAYEDWGGKWDGTNGQLKIAKYLVMDKSIQNVPEVSFEFTLSLPTTTNTNPKVLVEGDADHPNVYVGILPSDPDKILLKGDTAAGKYPTDSLTFGASLNDTTVDGDNDPQNLVDDAKKYVKKELTIDFSKVPFTEPGIYRYYLQESDGNGTIIPDINVADDASKTWRTIDVYVMNDTSSPNSEDKPKLVVDYVVYEGKLTGAPQRENDSSLLVTTPFDESSVTALTDTTWEYTDNTDPANPIKYEYRFVNGQWEEKRIIGVAPNITEEISRNVKTKLNDAVGTPSGETYETDEYGVAEAMGFDVTTKNWTYTEGGVTTTYTYDTVTNKWTATTVVTSTANAPADDAESKIYTQVGYADSDIVNGEASTTGYGAQTISYGKAKEPSSSSGITLPEHYVDRELIKYVWTKVDGDKTIKYTYNATNQNWDVTETTSKEETPNAKATTSPKVTVSPVKYSYVYALEKSKHDQSTGTPPTKPNPNGAEVAGGKKSEAYVNEYAAHNIKLSKKVTGNQGSRDKYFKFTIEITNGGKETVMNLLHKPSNLVTVPTGKENVPPNDATEYTFKTIVEANAKDEDVNVDGYQVKTNVDGKATIVVYLRHGDEITIEGVREGASYSIKETEANTDGYLTKVELDKTTGDYQTETVDGYEYNGTKYDTLDEAKDAVDTTTGAAAGNGDYTLIKTVYKTEEIKPDTTKTVDLEDSSLLKDAIVAYTNDKQGILPTGVIMSVAGGVGLVGIAAIGLFALSHKKKEEDDE